MINQAIASIAIKDKEAIQVGLFCAYSCMRRGRLFAPRARPGRFRLHSYWISLVKQPCFRLCLSPSPLLFILAQSPVITLFAARHDTRQVVHTAPHIPLEDRASV